MLKKYISYFALFMLLALGVANAQKPGANADIERLDPALDALVPPNAKLEMLKFDYFGLVEGPLWIQEGRSGYLLFTDISANHIYKWTPDGQLSVFVDRTGFNSADTSSLQTAGYLGGYNGRFYPVAFGSNGTTIDQQGRLIWCAQGDRAIVRLEKDGTRTILADHYEGKRLNRPNDVVVKSDGWVYFTDTRSNNPGAAQEFDFSGVYRVKDGKVELLEKDDMGANGLVFSPDEKTFYVGGAKIWRYDVQADGTIANRREISSPGCDGMKVDTKGNIFCATPTIHGVRILTPEGKQLGTILTPQDGMVAAPTNIAFGDADGKTLYITLRRSLARIRLNTTGVLPPGSKTK